MKEKKTIKFSKIRLKEVCQKFNIKLVILFGSYARREGIAKDSDIDLGILCENGKNIKKKDLLIIQEFSKVFKDERVDITYLNHADPLLLFEIVKNGDRLFQDKKGRYAEFKIKAIKRHFDAEKFYRLEDLCLEKFMRHGV